MALANSNQAIGAVSKLLSVKLSSSTGYTEVTIGRPEEATSKDGPKLNLFLYQVDFDGALRNHSLDPGQHAPLWLVLRYLLTAFDKDKRSDSEKAHNMLGEGMLALHELNFIDPVAAELSDNPEPLKITFDSADAELLSKIMQGSDEKYRISAAFQVRPVMIAPTVAPSYALPVKTVGPPGNEGVAVLPSMGPVLDSVDPVHFEAGEQIVLRGNDLAGITKVSLGGESVSVSLSASNELRVTVPSGIALSAGSHVIRALHTSPSGREMSSNAVLGHLLPTLDVAIHDPLTSASGGKLSGDLKLQGKKLGSEKDNIFVAFYRDGKVEMMLEANGSAAQTSLTIPATLAAGSYFIILRVNGEQAKSFPEVNWS